MVNHRAIRCRSLMCCYYMLCAVWTWGATGCKSESPASKTSVSDMAKWMRISLPDRATNVRSHTESLFTLTCVLSIDIPNDDVESFLGRNEVLPDRDRFSEGDSVAARVEAVGSSAPWWDLEKHEGCVFAESRGQRETQGKKYNWLAAAALAPLSDKRTRVFIAYVEEAAVEQ